jgi:uncharacterized protein
MSHQNPSEDELRILLRSSPTIAMVGASSRPDRPSHRIMERLLARGFHVIPVNPGEQEVLGQRAYPDLAAIRERVDIVDVFRRAEDAPPIADGAVAIGARALWLQLGISSDDAATRARAGGLTVVMNACIGALADRLDVRPDAPRKHTEERIDESLEESFPASDPPAHHDPK